MLKLANALCLLLLSLESFPCTSLSYEGPGKKTWVAKSFDFASGKGYVFINKRNIQKKSLTFSFGLGKKWTSEFGSVTFNQVGRDFPFGGLNEKGLSMEILWLDDTKYPEKVQRKNQVNESQLIQYVLDTATTVPEALDKIRSVSLVPIIAPVHYMICDVRKDCVVVEYLNQKLEVIPMLSGKERILQNIVYQDMIMSRMRPLGESERVSADDINTIFDNSSIRTEEEMVKKSFSDLDRVFYQDSELRSQWQIVYNLDDKKIWFRSVNEPTIKSIDFGNYEFDCRIDPLEKVIDIDSPVSGDVQVHLVPFTKKINKGLLSAFDSVPGWVRDLGNVYSLINHKCKKF